jgi:hypothetical protein
MAYEVKVVGEMCTVRTTIDAARAAAAMLLRVVRIL